MKPFVPSFYRYARALPDSPAMQALRTAAAEIYRDLGGEAVERAIAMYETIAQRWLAANQAEATTDAARAMQPVGLREAMRAAGATDRGYVRKEKLREQAWLEARQYVFATLGQRIELPRTPEQHDREAGFTSMPHEGNTPAPLVSPQAEAKPTEQQINQGRARLVRGGVARAKVEALDAEARRGLLTHAQFEKRINELVGRVA